VISPIKQIVCTLTGEEGETLLNFGEYNRISYTSCREGFKPFDGRQEQWTLMASFSHESLAWMNYTL